LRTHPRADQPLGGEQRHLRVVGDRPDGSVGLGEVADPLGSEALADALERVELDRRAERIADGAAEQAAVDPRAQVGAHAQPRQLEAAADVKSSTKRA